MKQDDLGSKLKMLRKSRGLTQDIIADLLGVSRGNVSHYENNSRTPSIKSIEKLASFYNVSTEFLLPSADVDEVKDLLIKAEEIFKNDSIPQEDKINLFNKLNVIYLRSQNMFK